MEPLRVFIIEPAESMRESLALFVRNLGYEAIACSSPAVFPCIDNSHCETDKICGDALIVGQHLPQQAGLDFIAQRLAGPCRGLVKNITLICLPWSIGDQQRAERLGCRWLETPLDLGELRAWLATIAENLPADRKLVPLTELLVDREDRLPA
ncbi:hypothetical protein [Geothermobacter hydrogeniphilus]|uniref:Response regulatory domain-containing protein n=1 Tax=Geothermobacter hydrogeniphilus TaxID=1969733 RepID=A0A1X0XPE3_9BACT|nr:hypothetical protein [Geothermobacter hydrogeniphilus]ORJ54751.1 hypothetical protein B5V00_15635 [Geothermobacter hydrogeniphilus]